MTVETTCAICMDDFKAGDKVTQLKCNEGHIFHTECIVMWIQQGKNSCPICRAPIENIDELRAMMEGGELDALMAAAENAEGGAESEQQERQPAVVQRQRPEAGRRDEIGE